MRTSKHDDWVHRSNVPRQYSSYIGREGVYYLGDWTSASRYIRSEYLDEGVILAPGVTYALYILNLRRDASNMDDIYFRCDVGAHYGPEPDEYISGSYMILKDGREQVTGSEPILHAIIRAMHNGYIPVNSN